MPLVGSFAVFKRLRKNASDIATAGSPAQRRVGAAVVPVVKGLLREQHDRGVAPDGSPWKETTRGKAALLSRKLGNAWSNRAIANGLEFTAKVDWLEAHHHGHEFPARSSAGHRQHRNARGRLISAKKFRRIAMATEARNVYRDGGESYFRKIKSGKLKLRASRLKVGAHRVGSRVLPPRPLHPVGTMPPRWSSPIGEKVQATLAAGLVRGL